MSEGCAVLWMKQGKEGCGWCPVHCPESSRTMRPIQTKLGGQCCYDMYFLDCSGEIIDPPGTSYIAQARDEDGDVMWATLDEGFVRETDSAGQDYLHFCLNANTQPIRNQFIDAPGRCCKPRSDDELCVTLEIGWRDAEENWNASCDIRWCIEDAVIDPDGPINEIPSAEICSRVAGCFGGITSPDETIHIAGNFTDGFEITTTHTASCPPFTVNAGLTADATDDSLGTATLACGETIHFHSPDGLVTVTEGSAIVRIEHPDFCALLDELGDTVALDCAGLPGA